MTFGAVRQWSGCTKLEYSSNGPLVRERTAGTFVYKALRELIGRLLAADKR